MVRIEKFLGLPPADRRLLVHAFVLLATVKLRMWLLSRAKFSRFLVEVNERNLRPSGTARASIGQVSWAISIAGRYVPNATCLARAISARCILGDLGLASHLWIGVAQGKAGVLEAHAWVESEGRIVVGDLSDLSRYTRLIPRDGRLDSASANATEPIADASDLASRILATEGGSR